MPIVLAGKPMTGAEEQYFDDQVRPLIDGRDVRYAGPVSLAEKVALLQGAAALVFPIQWEEHFGLVMIEAMACGCPVVACRRGSVSEVVDGGITGFHAPSEQELVDLVPRALALDRRRVREHARRRFSVDRMVADHLDLYGELLARGAA
jgi:glycosyltransferase involved in cell wall biosynthesis